MSERTERNRQLARQWMDENWNQRKSDTVTRMMHTGCVGRMEHGMVHGPKDFMEARAGLWEAFPDMKMVIEQDVAEGDTVVLRWRVNATHGGSFGGIAATKRPVDIVGSTWFTFNADGQVAGGFDTWNMGALATALAAP
ncbi:MAG: ester cyclase [Burkholderiales bacterium]|nr:ester cyclase [Burkholderiales bacterium]